MKCNYLFFDKYLFDATFFNLIMANRIKTGFVTIEPQNVKRVPFSDWYICASFLSASVRVSRACRNCDLLMYTNVM
jgi:hypothetical protein